MLTGSLPSLNFHYPVHSKRALFSIDICESERTPDSLIYQAVGLHLVIDDYEGQPWLQARLDCPSLKQTLGISVILC